jgi:hypothetical protein
MKTVYRRYNPIYGSFTLLRFYTLPLSLGGGVETSVYAGCGRSYRVFGYGFPPGCAKWVGMGCEGWGIGLGVLSSRVPEGGEQRS